MKSSIATPLIYAAALVVTYQDESPAYEVLRTSGLLTTKYRRQTVEDIFTGDDVR